MSFALGFGRRVRRTVGATTVRYLYNGGELIAEVNAAGAAIAQYTYHGLDAPHSMRRNGKLYYYLQDGLGHVRALVDTAGAVAATYAYTPYGTAEAVTETVENPLRFKGREWDAAAGLYFLRARYYDPQLGRFLAPDPLGVAGGVNLYAFAGGDPANAADPTGLQAVEGAAFAPYGPLAATALAPTWGPAFNTLAFNSLLWTVLPGRNFDGSVNGPGADQSRDDPPVVGGAPDPSSNGAARQRFSACIERNAFSARIALWSGSSGVGFAAAFVEISAPTSLALDVVALSRKNARQFQVDRRAAWASGMNRLVRTLPGGSVRNLLHAAGDRLTLPTAVAGAFTAGFNASVALRCAQAALK